MHVSVRVRATATPPGRGTHGPPANYHTRDAPQQNQAHAASPPHRTSTKNNLARQSGKIFLWCNVL